MPILFNLFLKLIISPDVKIFNEFLFDCLFLIFRKIFFATKLPGSINSTCGNSFSNNVFRNNKWVLDNVITSIFSVIIYHLNFF